MRPQGISKPRDLLRRSFAFTSDIVKEPLEPIHASHKKTGEVAITTLDFLGNEMTTLLVGTGEGNVHPAGAAGSYASAITPIYSFEEAEDYVYHVK